MAGEDERQRLLTVAEVSAWLKMSEQWVRSHANKHRKPYLRCIKMGPSLRFRRSDVERFIEQCSTDIAA